MRELPDHAFARLATELSEATTVDQTAAQIVAFGMKTVGAQFAGITMIRGRGKFETVGASEPLVVDVDQLQYDLREGPGVDVATTAQVVMSVDLAADDRWPGWGPAAVRLGFRSILSAELHAGGRRIGAINLYGDKIRQFTNEDADVAQLFASHAAAALAAVSLREGLQNALDTRTVIGQAQGILMGRFGIDADRAFSILRRYSQDKNVKLTDVARDLIITMELPD
ncbi:MAG: GAF and ANTAR domain-containing protein, partial [Flavobacterium sp.]